MQEIEKGLRNLATPDSSPEGDTQTPYFTALDDTEGPKCGPVGEILESILSNLECLKTVLGVTETANYETEAGR